ncbi:MAG TPA: 4-hydroxythreonine-4-phosphate dehydrogenase PdxA [Hellea balneolensis]|uniref:4-hydroxythreonine-4-phosphate dehydrogenase n=1 Tax=Hellea balneolensis TaxID=287478 RepID=A0A7C5QZI7_9PROT|nr:4-hydroxythreonine-4-phosphate dehydrogenase PdxA [Hellea balneolensis]
MKAPIAISMGDPAGIGPEITMAAWRVLRDQSPFCFFVIGNPDLYDKAVPIDDPNQAASVFADGLPVLAMEGVKTVQGQPNPLHAQAITLAIEKGVKYCLQGKASALVTNPIAKSVLYTAGFKFPGHTEFLAELCKAVPAPYAKGPVMLLSAGGLHVALATIHIPLSQVCEHITIEMIQQRVRTLNGALRIDMGIDAPRIALAGLNPHAGENGSIGREDIDIINVAAEALRQENIDVSNARSADTLFHAEARKSYDAVLAMYHDQGLIPVKTLDFHGGVNTTLGLPIIRTSPDHGTAFDIAGRGIARPDSLIAAIKMANNMSENRRHHDRHS